MTTVRTSLRTISSYPLKGGAIKLAFYSPTLTEKNEAQAITDEYRALIREMKERKANENAQPDPAFEKRVLAVSGKADELMLRLLAFVVIRGEEVQADDALRNEVREAAYLDGGLGLQLMQDVCFPTWYEAPQPSDGGSGGPDA